MAVLDEDFCTDLMTPEGGDTLWSLPFLVPACDPLDWESLHEQAEARVKEERGRANVAELRCEELRRLERDACSRARSLERQLDTCRFKLKAAVAEAKDTASAVSSAPKIGSRAAKALERRVKSQDDEIADLRVSLLKSHEHRERIEARHRDDINWLKQDIDRGRSEIVKVSRRGNRAVESLRKQAEHRLAAARRLVEAREGTIAWLRERNDRLRAAVVRATGLIASLREKNGRLRAEVRDLTAENAALASRVETLQAQLDRLRSTRSVLSKALYGSRSEQQKKPGAGHKPASSAAPPDTGAPSAPGSGRRRKHAIRRRMRASARVAANPMPPTASGAPPSSRSRSRPTRRRSSARATAGHATAPPRRAKRPRRRWRGCSTTRPTGSASGCACSTSASSAAVPCIGSRPGWSIWGWRSRRGRWPTAPSASCRCSSRWPRRSSRTKTRRRCAMPTKHPGAFRRIARKAGRAAPGCGPRSATTPSTSTSTPRAVPRSR